MRRKEHAEEYVVTIRLCRACEEILQPATVVPSWDHKTLRDDPAKRHYYEQALAKCQAEVAEHRVGYRGEGHFCGVQCAASYGRAVATYLRSKNLSYFAKAIKEVWKEQQKTTLWRVR